MSLNDSIALCQLTQILSQKAEGGLSASPSLPRHEFFIDFWNALFCDTKFCIERHHGMSGSLEDGLLLSAKEHVNSSSLEPMLLIQDGGGFLVDESQLILDSEALLEDVQLGRKDRHFAETTFQLKIQKGMLILQEKGLSHVICMIQDLRLPHASMVEEFVSVCYLAKLFHLPLDAIKAEIRKWTQLPSYSLNVGTEHELVFEDHSAHSAWYTLGQTLRYHQGDLFFILQGDLKNMPVDIKELFVRKEAVLICLDCTISDETLTEYCEVVNTSSMKEAVATVWGLVENSSHIFLYPGLSEKETDSQKWTTEYRQEVLTH